MGKFTDFDLDLNVEKDANEFKTLGEKNFFGL